MSTQGHPQDITRPQVASNLYEFLYSAEHKERYVEECR